MTYTTKQKLAINMKVARDMGIPIMEDWVDNKHPEAVITDDIAMDLFNIFDPDNTSALNKAVEFYKLDVVNFGQEWHSHNLKRDFPRPINVYKVDVSRDISMRQAVTAASGANQTKEDE